MLEIKTNNEVKRIRETNLYHEGNGVFEVKASELDVENSGESEVNCKICCCNEQTEDNPLISPCLCKGSCAKIHLGCLRQWITSKVKK